MDYIILTDGIPSGLTAKVKEYIKMGWKPQGGITTDRVFGFAQAMVK